MYFPAGVSIDNAGNLYIADYSYSRIREVSAKTGVITTVAGTGQPGYSGDGGAATAAQLHSPFAVTTDSGGNLYVADTFNNVIREVDATNGVISTVAGNGFGAGYNNNGVHGGGYTGDGGPATSAELNDPLGVAVDSAGNLYIADGNNYVIRMVAAASGNISTVAGDGSACTSLRGDGGPATSAGFCYPEGVTADGAGNLYIADDRTPRIRQVRVSSLPPTTQNGCPNLQHSTGNVRRPANSNCFRQHTRRDHLCHLGWIHSQPSRNRISGTDHRIRRDDDQGHRRRTGIYSECSRHGFVHHHVGASSRHRDHSGRRSLRLLQRWRQPGQCAVRLACRRRTRPLPKSILSRRHQ
jgi:hypothetical protein